MYFVPAIVAQDRGHHQAGAIFVLNLLAGWTVVGWVIAAVWSAMPVRPDIRAADRAEAEARLAAMQARGEAAPPFPSPKPKPKPPPDDEEDEPYVIN